LLLVSSIAEVPDHLEALFFAKRSGLGDVESDDET
jgi:hypothetical protein